MKKQGLKMLLLFFAAMLVGVIMTKVTYSYEAACAHTIDCSGRCEYPSK